MRNRFLNLVVMSVLPFAAAAAQDAGGPSNVLSFQPLNAVVLTAYSAEYERKIGDEISFGIGGTHWNVGNDANDLTYQSGDVKLRFYPQGNALQGFSLGGSVGFSRISATNDFDGTEDSASGPSFGVLIEYQWLMGKARNFALALGLGAKAVMVDEDEITSDDFVARYPTARVSVGYAF